jgi:hypothetical protein
MSALTLTVRDETTSGQTLAALAVILPKAMLLARDDRIETAR